MINWTHGKSSSRSRRTEREELLVGMAWKGQCLSGTEKRKFKATLVPTLNSGGRGVRQHEGTRVA